VARHELITAHLDALAARLPGWAMEELADGLEETFEQQLATHGDPNIAAQAAIDEFGDADVVSTAFLRNSPERRTALALLATGPVLAVAWAATLVAGQASTWPVPIAARVLYGAALMSTVFALLVAAREKHAYRRARRAAVIGTVGLLLLDGLMLTTIAIITPGVTWPMTLAVAASLTRMLATTRALPAILVG
jgi:hypothetical protein